MRSRLAAPILTLGLTGAAATVWPLLYPISDWAALALLLPGVPIWLGLWQLGLARRRAWLSVSLQPDVWIQSFLKGRISSLLTASAFTALFLWLLAWQVGQAVSAEAAIYAVLVAFAAFSAVQFQRILLRSVRPPFAAAWSITLVTLLCGLLFTPVLAYVAWAHKVFPGEIRDAPTLLEAMVVGIQIQPAPRQGWIAEALGYLHAAEAAHLWLATRETWSDWAPWLFAVHSALFSLVLARGTAVLALFVETRIGSDT